MLDDIGYTPQGGDVDNLYRKALDQAIASAGVHMDEKVTEARQTVTLFKISA